MSAIPVASVASRRAASSPLRVALVGGGTVGGGVYEILMGRQQGRHAVVTKLCVRDATKPRSFVVQTDHTSVVTDVAEVLKDDNIDVVVEVMGGTGVAKTLAVETLKAGKSFVTANKALLAEHLKELLALTDLNPNGFDGKLAFEAAVCGGIPIIHTLQSCLAGDVVHEVMGICNGTTNYMLDLMETNPDADYDAALKEAQDLGYAEADPTADVEGHDVRAKICLLAKLAFGKSIENIEQVPCKGISQINTVDFEYAKLLNCTIKLIGTAVRLNKFSEHDGALSVYVTPKMVPLDHALAGCKTNGNGVVLRSANLGTTSYMGPGAGRYETANSVVADVLRIAHGTASHKAFPNTDESLELDSNYESPFYVRIPYSDTLGVVRQIGESAEACGISIHSMLQNPIQDRMQADVCVLTETCGMKQMEGFIDKLEGHDFCRVRPVYMPLLKEL